MGIGGAPCIIDNRFILIASVGLIVRAPKPVACPGITDSRLLDDGVVLPTSSCRSGDREDCIEEPVHGLSGVLSVARRGSRPFFLLL